MDTEKLKARLLDKVVAGPNGCIVWVGGAAKGGYGLLRNGRQKVYAHRLSHELFVGPIPDGYEVDHLCRNTRCIRPDHLEAVTSRENWRRSNNIMRIFADNAECHLGHPYEGQNVRLYRGWRRCRECERIRALDPAYKIKRNATRRENYRHRRDASSAQDPTQNKDPIPGSAGAPAP